MKTTIKLSISMTLLLCIAAPGFAEPLPLFNPATMEYKGAFRLPHGTFGDTRVVNSSGQIAVDEPSQTLFLTGSNNQSVAQFKIPANLSKSDNLTELPMADAPLQGFSNIITRAETGNPNDVNVLTGMALIKGKLVLNAAVYYDGSGGNRDTTLIVEDPSNLSSSPVRGFMQLEGANHASGWITEVPPAYQETLGGDLIFGHASNLSINGRSSMGPSLFVSNEDAVLSSKSGEPIEAKALVDFSIDNLLHPDLKNESLQNDLWTELSEAYYGFIVPGSRTYFTIGQSGGHNTGIGYKITQPNGYQCGGYCAEDHRDYYNYIWLWDMDEVERSLNGEIEPYQVRPYKWQELNLAFQDRGEDLAPARIIGATSTPSGLLYLVLDKVDNLQSNYSTLPIILVYDMLSGLSLPSPPLNVEIE